VVGTLFAAPTVREESGLTGRAAIVSGASRATRGTSVQESVNLAPAQRLDYEAFKRRIRTKCGVDLSLYKEEQMHRRLCSLLERSRADSFAAYFALLERDHGEWTRFLDRMTINVSELFRNPERWVVLRRDILPALLSERSGLRIWSAGCSYGAEPHSLAMLLEELAPTGRHYLLATDIDEAVLAKAREGQFTDADVRGVPDALARKYLKRQGDGWEVIPTVRRRVTFKRQNLLADPFERGFDLIACRNVVIYFTDDAKGTLYARFRDSLAPGGYIFVGGTERIFNANEIGLSSRYPFFYEHSR
jgi:chemotaxis protein methyltransferase CheR